MDDTNGFDGLNLSRTRSLPGLLERLPQGLPARDLAEKLGVWTGPLHQAVSDERKATPADWSKMSDGQLSDWNGYWNSEVQRATELLGLLGGQQEMLNIKAKSLRAAARSRVRKEQADKEEKAVTEGVKLPKLTAGEITDRAEEDNAVIEMDHQLALVAVVIASARAYKEAAQSMTAGLSREISFRQAQMAAALRYRS